MILRSLTVFITGVAFAWIGCCAISVSLAEQYVVVVLDDSGSMQAAMPSGIKRMDAAKRALKTILEQLPKGTSVGVLALNTRIDDSPWVIPVGQLESTDWQQRVDAIRAKGGTLLGRYMKVGADELLKFRATDRYATFRLLVVTDGEANDPAILASYLPDILSRGIALNVIGVSMSQSHSLAGMAHSYREADDLASLTTALSQVMAESIDDDPVAAAGEFELLEGLPDGFAEEALKALGTIRNDPIQAVEFPSEFPGEPAAIFQTPQPNVSSQTKQSSVFDLLMGSFCCCGGILALFFFAVAFFFSIRGTRK